MTSSRFKLDRKSAHSNSLRIGATEMPEHLVSGHESDATDLNSDGFVISPSFDVLQLSAAQRGIWFAQHLAGSSPISVAQYVDIVGEVDPELLVRAGDTACREFGSGYMRLIEIDGEPRQIVDETLESPVSLMDLRGHDDPVAAAHRMMVDDYSAPMDILNDRLMKSVVFHVDSQHFLWYQRAHHGPMPLSPIMHDRGHIDRFAQAALVELPEQVERAALLRALQSVLDRHDMLRAVLRGDEPAERGVDVRELGAVDANDFADPPSKGSQKALASTNEQAPSPNPDDRMVAGSNGRHPPDDKVSERVRHR